MLTLRNIIYYVMNNLDLGKNYLLALLLMLL